MVALVAALPPLLAWAAFDSSGVGGASMVLGITAAALVGVLIMPAAALAVYVNHAGLAAFAPHLWFRIIGRMPRDYTRVAGLYAALMVVQVLWAVCVGVVLGGFPLIASFVHAVGACLPVFAMAVILGGIVNRNRLELGL